MAIIIRLDLDLEVRRRIDSLVKAEKEGTINLRDALRFSRRIPGYKWKAAETIQKARERLEERNALKEASGNPKPKRPKDFQVIIHFRRKG